MVWIKEKAGTETDAPLTNWEKTNKGSKIRTEIDTKWLGRQYSLYYGELHGTEIVLHH